MELAMHTDWRGGSVEQGQTITPRQREILTAIVETYIATGEPVSSGSVARSEALISRGLSSATVRNEMAELHDAGWLEQPHTSAGRVPAAQAFKLYVEGLRSGSAGRLQNMNAQMQSQIDTSFAGVAGAEALLERTSHVLAALSSGVGVAIGTAAISDLLEHVHFSRLATKRVLAVVVTRSGNVRDRVLTLDQDVAPSQLENAANFLNEHFRGWHLEAVRAELDRRIERERSVYQQLMTAAATLWARTLPEDEPAEQTVFVDGVANLVGLPEDRMRLREMLGALEEKKRLVELLNAYIDARQSSVSVIFGLEQQAPEMAGLVLIAAPVRVAGDGLATVGVLGPKRMQYRSAMDAVGYVAQLFNRMSDPMTT
jgi:heat-inducible transcriptional repressor